MHIADFPSVALVAMIVVSSAAAQETSAWIGRSPAASSALAPPEAPHRHSSTYQEGVQRGRAALERAWGDRALLEAQSAILFEQARAMQMDNHLKMTSSYIVRQQMLDDFRHQERIDRITRTQQLRQLKEIDKLRKALDYALTEFDVDFQTGTVYWPALVAGPRYAEYRRELDHVIADILSRGTITDANREKLVSLCNQFRHQLHHERLDDPHGEVESVQAEYAAADRLLKGLRYTPVVIHSNANLVSMR